MASIDQLNLRVRLLPLLLRREVEVSTAELIGLQFDCVVHLAACGHRAQLWRVGSQWCGLLGDSGQSCGEDDRKCQ